MHYFFITGTSKGLGKALTELLLSDKNNFVYGISRTNNIHHQQFQHLKLDLADLSAVQKFNYPELKGETAITLINNAGIVGDIKHLGNLDSEKIISTYSINLISPTILTNLFVSTFKGISPKLVINISSGAGRSPIDGWSVYCASKAGLDMLSLVFKTELEHNNINTKIISLAPGIIDTSMQDEIRKADKANFSNIERFVEYKNNGDLSNPKETAKQVYAFITNQKLHDKTICSVRDLA